MEMACVALAVRTHDATGRYGLLCLCIESKSAALYLADQIRKSHYMDTSCARQARAAHSNANGYAERRLAMSETMVARLQIVRIIISPSAS